MINKSYGIIGGGKLSQALLSKMYPIDKIRWIVDRSAKIRWNEWANVEFTKDLSTAFPAVDCIILAVPDKNIAEIAYDLCKLEKLGMQFNAVCHLSGFLNIEVFSQLSAIGKICFSAHPMQSFGIARDDVFEGIFWGIEASDDAIEMAEEFVGQLGGKPHRLPREILDNKAAYHTIGVASANFLQSSIEFAKILVENLNLPANEILIPILKTAFDNSIQSIVRNEKFPLTGPVARGDLPTIRAHLQSLKGNAQLLEIYINQTKALAATALVRSVISEKVYKEIEEIIGRNL